MTTLFGRAPKDSFQELLKLNNTGAGVDSTLRAIQDGAGNSTPLQLSTTQIALNGALWPTSVGTSGQVLTAGSNGTLSWSTLASSSLTYKGTWNATTNTPTLTSGSGTTGAMYKVSTASTVVTQTLKNAQSGGGTQLFLNSSTGIVPGMAIYYGATFLGIVSTASGGNVVSVAPMAYSNIAGSMTFTTYLDGINAFNVGDYVFFDGTAWELIAGSNSAPVTSVFGRTGAVSLTSGDVTTALTFTPVNPAAAALTGTPTAPTATAGTNTTQIATTAFVNSAVSGSGVAPNTTLVSATLSTSYNIATTNNVFYNFTASATQVVLLPAANTLTQGWTTTVYLNASTSTATSLTIGPNGSDFFLQTGNAASNFPALLGYTYKITALPSLNRFIVDVAGTLQAADVTKSLGFTPAALASPTFTGTPAAPTATAGTNTTQLATTAFVTTAVAAGTGTNKYTSNIGTTSATTVAMGNLYTCTSAGYTMTLPALSGVTNGQIVTILNGAASGVITVVPTGSDKLWGFFGPQGGVATMTLAAGESVTFTALPAQTAWDVINYTRSTASPTFTGRTQSDAYSYTVKQLTITSGAVTIDMSTASEFAMTITGATTVTITNTPASTAGQVVYVRITSGASGNINWPTGMKYASGTAPTYTSGVDLVGILYDAVSGDHMLFVIGQNIQ